VARAAGFPGAARQVVGILRTSVGLPWQRVLGAGGEIKLRGDSAFEQRFRLQAEGVTFRGRRVDIKQHEYKFRKKRSSEAR
jgi:methylated-DNA-protein-cysteine methyltransferase related protein